MERTSLPAVAGAHEQPGAAGGLQRLRRQLESLRLRSLDSVCFVFALAAAVLGAGWFVALSLERHRDFQSYAYDLGFFDQIVWNTSQGRLFETSFVPYNFLGQHFEPVLAVFAVLYRLGAGVESLLIAQGLLVGLAALPLYLSTRAITARPLVGAAVVVAFLFNPTLHEAVFFGFHPEMLSLPFVFTGLYLLLTERPVASALGVAPIVLLKEDMAIVVVAFAVLIWFQGYRSQAVKLGAFGVFWFLAIGLVVMAALRGGGASDVTLRFDYLVAGSDTLSLVPNAVSRGASTLHEFTLPHLRDILLWQGFLPLLSPVSLLAAPSTVANGLSSHWEQSRLQLQYSTATLTLLWVGSVMALGMLAGLRKHRRGPALAIAVGAMLVGSIVGFATRSELAPGVFETQLTAAHRDALHDAIAHIPPDASVDAQSTIVPHVSGRAEIYEFPARRVSDYVIVDAGLPVANWSIIGGYREELETLPANGYEKVFDREGVEVWQRTGR